MVKDGIDSAKIVQREMLLKEKEQAYRREVQKQEDEIKKAQAEVDAVDKQMADYEAEKAPEAKKFADAELAKLKKTRIGAERAEADGWTTDRNKKLVLEGAAKAEASRADKAFTKAQADLEKREAEFISPKETAEQLRDRLRIEAMTLAQTIEATKDATDARCGVCCSAPFRAQARRYFRPESAAT